MRDVARSGLDYGNRHHPSARPEGEVKVNPYAVVVAGEGRGIAYWGATSSRCCQSDLRDTVRSPVGYWGEDSCIERSTSMAMGMRSGWGS